jgi:hypothetical protein
VKIKGDFRQGILNPLNISNSKTTPPLGCYPWVLSPPKANKQGFKRLLWVLFSKRNLKKCKTITPTYKENQGLMRVPFGCYPWVLSLGVIP